MRGETNVSKVGTSIKRLRLEPEDCQPLPEALAAIYEADIISIGPGSLFTSLLPPILVEGVSEAIAESPAVKIFICNLMTQPGETDGFSARKHLELIWEYAPGINFDYVIVNNFPITEEQIARYTNEGARQIGISDSISPQTIEDTKIVYGNLLDAGEKVRHNSQKLAQVVLSCALKSEKSQAATAESIWNK